VEELGYPPQQGYPDRKKAERPKQKRKRYRRISGT
jgi:hypothetical protein